MRSMDSTRQAPLFAIIVVLLYVACSPEVQAESSRSVPARTPSVVVDELASGGRGPDLVVISAGSFNRGSHESDPLRRADEGPVKLVSIDSFAIGRFEVTVAQFRRFVEATNYVTDAERGLPMYEWSTIRDCDAFIGRPPAGSPPLSWRNSPANTSSSSPVTCVSWNDAKAYVDWLSEETGKAYRLPTEAEFEFVIRSGSTSRFAWGDDFDGGCAFANYADRNVDTLSTSIRVPSARCDDGFAHVASVGQYTANAFGLFDAAGNVAEWAEDCKTENYEAAPVDGAPDLSGDCSRRILRGGDWFSNEGSMRASFRNVSSRTGRSDAIGFRVARGIK